jgi:thiamine pyrophosphokinase
MPIQAFAGSARGRPFLRAVIFAAGELADPRAVVAMLEPTDLIIGADGGSRHLADLDIVPDIVVGDFDSTSEEVLRLHAGAGARIIRHPRRKDRTDLELAIDLAARKGAREILIAAGMGGRWDQSLASLLLPAAAARRNLHVRLVDGVSAAEWVRGGATLLVRGKVGDTASLIALGGDAVDVSSAGLEYELDHDTLVYGSTRGISNVIAAHPCSVTLGQGQLLCVVTDARAEQIL